MVFPALFHTNVALVRLKTTQPRPPWLLNHESGLLRLDKLTPPQRRSFIGTFTPMSVVEIREL